MRGRSPAPMSECWPEDTDFPEAYLRRSRASPEVTLGSDAPPSAGEASPEDSRRRRHQLRPERCSPEERTPERKNVRSLDYNGRQLSDILKGTFSRKAKEALSVIRERRYYKWLPVIIWIIVIFILSAQPADQSIVLSGSVTRFFADALNQLSAFIEYFTRAQGTVVFLAGILLLIYLLETEQDEPKLFSIKKRWIIVGTAIFLVLAISLFLLVDFVQDTSITYAGRLMRKSAHFIAYLILGFLVSHAMKNDGSTALAWKRRGASLLLCVAYAISDEIHQIFVPGRGPLVKDILIDGAGAVIGIMLYFGVRKLWMLRKNKQPGNT